MNYADQRSAYVNPPRADIIAAAHDSVEQNSTAGSPPLRERLALVCEKTGDSNDFSP